MSDRPQKAWHPDVRYITFSFADGRITVFKSAMEDLHWPAFYRFLYNSSIFCAIGFSPIYVVFSTFTVKSTHSSSRSSIISGAAGLYMQQIAPYFLTISSR